jgi:uncharacterized protein YacL
MVQFIVIACLVIIVGSLGFGLFHLVSDKGESKKMVRALTIRIGVSLALFVFLLVAWWQGWIHPASGMK